jgi:hypothetical protein
MGTGTGVVMDTLRSREIDYRLQHQHADGTWSPMTLDSHDSAGRDPERGWLRRMVFRCTTCDETAVVHLPTDASAGSPA